MQEDQVCHRRGGEEIHDFPGAPVRKPLASLAKIVKVGYTVVMDVEEDGGFYIEKKITVEKTYMREESNAFVFVWLPPAQGFLGQGP